MLYIKEHFTIKNMIHYRIPTHDMSNEKNRAKIAYAFLKSELLFNVEAYFLNTDVDISSPTSLNSPNMIFKTYKKPINISFEQFYQEFQKHSYILYSVASFDESDSERITLTIFPDSLVKNVAINLEAAAFISMQDDMPEDDAEIIISMITDIYNEI